MMRSAAKLSYQQAQFAIGGRTDEDTEALVKPVLAPLYAAYETLTRARAERRPLDLDLPERKILLKGDGTVDRVIMPERLEAHRLIEEFMILANVAAAETLEKARVPLIYRVHDEPGMEKVNALREFLATLDIPFPKGGALRAEDFNRVLARVKGRDAEQLVNEVVLRTPGAGRIRGGELRPFRLEPAPLRAFHLADPPLCRPDRASRADPRAQAGRRRPARGRPTARRWPKSPRRFPPTERRAMLAERETNDRLIAHFLADRVGATFDGRVSGVHRAGLFVKLHETGADGFVPARTIGDEYFRHDEAGHAMVGARSGETYRLGDRVTVKLVEAAPVAGALRFELLSEGRAGKPQRRPQHEPRRQERAKANRQATEGTMTKDAHDAGSGQSLGRAHDQGGARPVVPRQRAARRGDPDADRPLRRQAEGAARPPPCQPQIHAGQVRVSRRAHRAARPHHAGGKRTASRHAEETAGAREDPGRRISRAPSRSPPCARWPRKPACCSASNATMRRRRRARSGPASPRRGVHPDLAQIHFIARAITPPRRPKRYDTRFFTADASSIAHRIEGVVGPDSELVELAWVPIEEATHLDMPTITGVVLEELAARVAAGMGHDLPVPFYFMIEQKFLRELL